jgi:hypothetical protein
MIGYIPKKILYITREPSATSWSWEDGKKVDTGIVVKPTFPVDPSKPKTIDTARTWANRYISSTDPFIKSSFVGANTPIKIQILSLEQRSEGGRAYKVVFGSESPKFYVDLREDVLLDVILNCGIQKGGFPNAEFIWGKVGSQMKLVRVGSDLHTRLIQATVENQKKNLTQSQIEVGSIYQNRKGQEFLYLGQYTVLDYTEHEISSREPFTEFDVKWVVRHVWLNIVSYGQEYAFWKFEFQKSTKTVIKKVGERDITGWIKKTQNQTIKEERDERERASRRAQVNTTFKKLRRALYYGSYMHFFTVDEKPHILTGNGFEFLRPIIDNGK